MFSKWTQHLKTDEEKELFTRQLSGARPVLERLADLMKEEHDALERVENSTKIYDLPNWDYRQAHAIGFRAHRAFVDKLINLDQQRGTTNDR